jgi:hypothetical protein
LQRARFGPPSLIQGAKAEFEEDLCKELEAYVKLNKAMNPWRVVGPFLTAGGVALVAWAVRQLIELTCAPWLDVCRQGSQLFAFVYSAIILGMLIIAYLHWSSLKGQFSAFGPALQQVWNVAQGGMALAGQQAAVNQPVERGSSVASSDAPTPATVRLASGGADLRQRSVRQTQ